MNEEPTKPADIESLYRRAFSEFGAEALWNMHPIEGPGPLDVLAVTKALRTHGGMDGRRLAEQIERVGRATYLSANPCAAGACFRTEP